MKKTLKIMLAAVLSIAMLMTFAAAAEDTLTNAGTADLVTATAPESDTIATHHDEHALDVFTDAPAVDSWKYQGLNCAVNNGTMTGHNNKIRPDDSLTRAEMVTMMVRVLGAHATKAEIEHYVDVVAGQWYYEALQSGVAVKIINGSGNKMMPNSPITREQTFTILARTFLFSAKTDATADFVDNSKVSSWALNATNALIDAEVVRGDNTKTLRPQDNVTRAEFAAMLDRVACLFVNTNANYSGKKVSGSLIVNDATADLSGATIEGDLIITDAVGAQNIDLSDVTVTGRIVIRGGDVNLNEGTTAKEVVVGNPTGASKVSAAENVTVDKVVVAENANDVEIDVPAKEVVIDSSKNEVVIKKDAEEVTVNGSDNTVKVAEGTKVDSVKTEGNNTNVAVDKGAKVENVTVNGESSKVTGSGDVGSATVNGYDSKVETPNTNVTDNSPATKPGSDDTTKPDSGKTDGKDNTQSKPNSDPNASTNSGSLPGTKPSTPSAPSVDIDRANTYITYSVDGGEEKKLDAGLRTFDDGEFAAEIIFDLGSLYNAGAIEGYTAEAYGKVALTKIHVATAEADDIIAEAFYEATGFTTNEELELKKILQKMVDSTSTAIAGLIGIETEEGTVTTEEYTLLKLATVLETACDFYVYDDSNDKWVQNLFGEFGIECSYADANNEPDENSAKATFEAQIGEVPVLITMVIPVVAQ